MVTFITLRIYLHHFPGTNLSIGNYNIHHLFTGLVFITAGGLPLIFFQGTNRLLDIAALVFGIGLSLALDEWVYLIATDGSDAAYLLPISLWGAVALIGLTIAYTLSLLIVPRFIKKMGLGYKKDSLL